MSGGSLGAGVTSLTDKVNALTPSAERFGTALRNAFESSLPLAEETLNLVSLVADKITGTEGAGTLKGSQNPSVTRGLDKTVDPNALLTVATNLSQARRAMGASIRSVDTWFDGVNQGGTFMHTQDVTDAVKESLDKGFERAGDTTNVDALDRLVLKLQEKLATGGSMTADEAKALRAAVADVGGDVDEFRKVLLATKTDLRATQKLFDTDPIRAKYLTDRYRASELDWHVATVTKGLDASRSMLAAAGDALNAGRNEEAKATLAAKKPPATRPSSSSDAPLPPPLLRRPDPNAPVASSVPFYRDASVTSRAAAAADASLAKPAAATPPAEDANLSRGERRKAEQAAERQKRELDQSRDRELNATAAAEIAQLKADGEDLDAELARIAARIDDKLRDAKTPAERSALELQRASEQAAARREFEEREALKRAKADRETQARIDRYQRESSTFGLRSNGRDFDAQVAELRDRRADVEQARADQVQSSANEAEMIAAMQARDAELAAIDREIDAADKRRVDDRAKRELEARLAVLDAYGKTYEATMLRARAAYDETIRNAITDEERLTAKVIYEQARRQADADRRKAIADRTGVSLPVTRVANAEQRLKTARTAEHAPTALQALLEHAGVVFAPLIGGQAQVVKPGTASTPALPSDRLVYNTVAKSIDRRATKAIFISAPAAAIDSWTPEAASPPAWQYVAQDAANHDAWTPLDDIAALGGDAAAAWANGLAGVTDDGHRLAEQIYRCIRLDPSKYPPGSVRLLRSYFDVDGVETAPGIDHADLLMPRPDRFYAPNASHQLLVPEHVDAEATLTVGERTYAITAARLARGGPRYYGFGGLVDNVERGGEFTGSSGGQQGFGVSLKTSGEGPTGVVQTSQREMQKFVMITDDADYGTSNYGQPHPSAVSPFYLKFADPSVTQRFTANDLSVAAAEPRDGDPVPGCNPPTCDDCSARTPTIDANIPGYPTVTMTRTSGKPCRHYGTVTVDGKTYTAERRYVRGVGAIVTYKCTTPGSDVTIVANRDPCEGSGTGYEPEPIEGDYSVSSNTATGDPERPEVLTIGLGDAETYPGSVSGGTIGTPPAVYGECRDGPASVTATVSTATGGYPAITATKIGDGWGNCRLYGESTPDGGYSYLDVRAAAGDDHYYVEFYWEDASRANRMYAEARINAPDGPTGPAVVTYTYTVGSPPAITAFSVGTP